MPSWPIWAAVGLYSAWQAAQVVRTWRRERALTTKAKTFTAPVSGWYHYVSGGTPRLALDCTPACPMHASKPRTTTVIEQWETEDRDA